MTKSSFKGNSRKSAGGFTLIEVMIAILVLAFGLLGFALLQTMSVRFTQSANYRTQATNLAYDLLDQMRVNRLLAARYGEAADFSAGEVSGVGCTRPTGVNLTPEQNADRWQCQVVEALGQAASANVTYANDIATVAVTWGDERWNDANNDGSVSDTESNKTITVSTRL